ncbi:MAG: hypothetical protein NUV80_01095 [Candidatus Berkelbacteria bacterium]|nr:hypothetical protein [Candidatus Berkelbacteria bacterium]
MFASKKDLQEMSATFLGALKQQKEELLGVINEKSSEKADEESCFCFIGSETGETVPIPVAHLISKEMKELMARYGLKSITALNVKKSVGQAILSQPTQ